jgi:DNA mismatch endonuclease (patch repair protein)
MTLTRSEIMARIKGSDTAPERELRRLLRESGARGYRKNWRGAPGWPDVAFTRLKLAVFVDGCFWHGCPEHYRPPREHADFWRRKLERNRRRDAEVGERLEASGWIVIRCWGHERPGDMAGKVLAEWRRLSASPSGDS